MAGVYTIAFLSVMSLFSFGNLLLKETRTELKRTYNTPILFVIIAFLSTFIGILGNIRIDANNLRYFEIYFIPSVIVLFGVIYKDYIMKFLLRITKNIPFIQNYILTNFNDMIQGRFVVFIHSIDRLYPILDYINKNETGYDIVIVHCKSEDRNKEYFEKIKHAAEEMQKAGVFPHFKLKFIYKEEEFGPKLVKKISKEVKTHFNRMLIGSIHEHHTFDYDELGGVRIIV